MPASKKIVPYLLCYLLIFSGFTCSRNPNRWYDPEIIDHTYYVKQHAKNYSYLPVGNVTYRLTEEAQKKLQDDKDFNPEILTQIVEQALLDKYLLKPSSEMMRSTLEIVINNIDIGVN